MRTVSYLVVANSAAQTHTWNNSPYLPSSACHSPGYQISYRLEIRDPSRWTTVEVGSTGRQFTVTGLSPEQAYVFRLTARTSLGWGEGQEALVVTTERRGKLTLSQLTFSNLCAPVAMMTAHPSKRQ